MSVKITFKTNNNIVSPISTNIMGFKVDGAVNCQKRELDINYNTYLMLSPLFKSLIVSTTIDSGKYVLSQTDLKNGYFFEYREVNMSIKVTFKALFNTNNKIKGIYGIQFISALNCPSNKLGYCQLPDGELCYARKGELQGSKKPSNFLMGMGSYSNSLINEYFWGLFVRSDSLKNKFLEYCTLNNINTIRFNLKGDFKSVNDINSLKYIATNSNIKLYGYTARDDLATHIFDLMSAGVVVNGSNTIYSNRFLITDSLYIWLNAQYRCIGECNNCKNCLKTHEGDIICLIHGAGSDSYLKTDYNIKFIVDFLNGQGLKTLTYKDLSQCKNKGLLSSLNKWLVNNGYNKFKGANNFKKYLLATYKRGD